MSGASVSYKRLFTRSLASERNRLHFAAHSHALWPDASFEGQLRCWEDAARLADGKWDVIMGEVWPAAQAHVARELNLPDPKSVVFASNTHSLFVALCSAVDRAAPRILTTDAEFHSVRRQLARWTEDGRAEVDVVSTQPFEDFPHRFVAAARAGEHDVIVVSHVFFGSGRVFEGVSELAALSRPEGPWFLIDGYHGFMALPTDLGPVADRAFYTAGGYKYAMAGEGAAFLHAPEGFAERPAITGWYAEFGELSGPPGGVGYSRDAQRLMGATFDPSGLYRFNAVRDMLDAEGLSTAAISEHVEGLKDRLLEAVASGAAGRLAEAELLNPARVGASARFLALRHPEAAAWKDALTAAGVITDVRRDVLRIGMGLYHDPGDVDALCGVLRRVL